MTGCQRFTAGKYLPNRSQASQHASILSVQILQKHVQHGWNEVHDADVVFLDGFNDGQRIPFPAWHQEAKFGTLQRPPEKLPHRNIEVVGRFLQDDVALIDRVGVLHPVQAVDEGAVLDHHSLGFAGRSGRINHIRQILRLVEDRRGSLLTHGKRPDRQD